MNSTGKCVFKDVIYTNITFSMKFTAIVTSVINALTSVSATSGNILIIYVVLHNKRLRNPSNLLLVSLSTTDFLMGLIVQPLSIVRRCFEIHNIHICTVRLIISYFGYLCGGASVINIALISIDRCFAVLFPFRYEIFSENKKYCWVIVATWTAWALVNLLLMLSVLSKETFFFTLLIMFVVSAVIIIISYCLIYRVVIKLRRQTLSIERNAEENPRRKQRKHHQMAKTFAIAIGVLLLCYIPTLIVSFIRTINGDTADMVYTGDAWGDMFAFINSSLNPIIYCYRMTDIREAMLNTTWRKILSRE